MKGHDARARIVREMAREGDGARGVIALDSKFTGGGTGSALRSSAGRFCCSLQRNPLRIQLHPCGNLLIALQRGQFGAVKVLGNLPQLRIDLVAVAPLAILSVTMSSCISPRAAPSRNLRHDVGQCRNGAAGWATVICEQHCNRPFSFIA